MIEIIKFQKPDLSEMNSTRPTRPPEIALDYGLRLRPSITKKIEIDQSPIPIYKEHKIIEKLQVSINMHVTYLHCVEILVIWRDVEPLVRRPEYVVDNFDFGLRIF